MILTVSIIVISETVFSKEVVVEKLQVSVSTKWPPTSFSYLFRKLQENFFP